MLIPPQPEHTSINVKPLDVGFSLGLGFIVCFVVIGVIGVALSVTEGSFCLIRGMIFDAGTVGAVDTIGAGIGAGVGAGVGADIFLIFILILLIV